MDDAGRVHDFSWLLRWGATWGTVEYVERSGDNSHVRERAVNFAIDLRTADPECLIELSDERPSGGKPLVCPQQRHH